MKQQLDRLIPTDDSHTVLIENKEMSIEVIPNNLMTFRIPSKGLKSPAKFIVKFSYNQSQTEDLTKGDTTKANKLE